jgi:ferredoxin
VDASFEVQFRESGRTLTWDGSSATLLDFAASHDISIPAGCRSGSCGTCETRLVKGNVAYATPPEYDVTAGFCLPCVAVPQSAVVLDA